MKKNILIAIFSIIMVSPILAQENNKKVKFYHAVEFDYYNELEAWSHKTDKSTDRHGPSLNFLFGAKFGDHIALAAGLGLTAPTVTYWGQSRAWWEEYLNTIDFERKFPVNCLFYSTYYLSLRYYILKNTKWTPMITIDGGERCEMYFRESGETPTLKYFWKYHVGGQIFAVRRFNNNKELYFGLGMDNKDGYSASIRLGVKL